PRLSRAADHLADGRVVDAVQLPRQETLIRMLGLRLHTVIANVRVEALALASSGEYGDAALDGLLRRILRRIEQPRDVFLGCFGGALLVAAIAPAGRKQCRSKSSSTA